MPRSRRALRRDLVTDSPHPTIRVLIQRTGHKPFPDPNVTEEPEGGREAEPRFVEIGA